ncbi:hypothetical protein J6590_103602, partial [Homalodisca vitripennis]
MGGVDASDKAVYHNSCNRHTTKYWKKVFFNIIDIALFNAYVLYKLNTDKPMQRRDFIISVVESLAAIEEDPVHVPGPAGDGSHKLDKLPGKSEWTCVVCKPLKKGGGPGSGVQVVIVESTGSATTNYNTSGDPRREVGKVQHLAVGVRQNERFPQ